MTRKIDDVANMWNETKDPKYKKLWYDLVKEFSNGPHNINRGKGFWLYLQMIETIIIIEVIAITIYLLTQ
jgi:hypothetical protein